MHLDNGGVQAQGLDAHIHQALALQLFEHHVEHAGLGPTAHAHVHGVPGSVVAGQCTPLAAVGRYVQDGIDHLQVL